MTIRKISAIILATAVLFGATLAFGAEYRTKLTLSVANGSSGSDEAYVLTVPADLTLSGSGWNSIGNVNVAHDSTKTTTTFDTSKKVVVTASSQNGGLTNTTDSTKKVSYTFKTAQDETGDGSSTLTLEFSAAEVNASSGTDKSFGIVVADTSSASNGTYEDYITYSADVQDVQESITWKEVNISTLTSYTAQNGDLLTGTAASSAHITVAAGATITLKNATITSIPNNESYKWAGITCAGDATIILDGTSAVKGGYEDYPGIYVPQNATLTIKGSGSLTASSNGYGAGIGGGYQIACGNIVIEGGNITATGGESAAGIGGGGKASCGDITIRGGTVSATGGMKAAGIGSGTGYDASCWNITITDGVTSVTATKGDNAPNSIGAGADGKCGTVTIADGANVTRN